MISAFANSLKIPELRQRILFTLAMIIIIRIGAAIPVPGVNSAVLGEFFKTVIDQQSSTGALQLFNIFTGGALENCAIFALGIMPYISASIMMQIFTAVVPSFGKMAREEGGRQKITQYTRYFTIVLCLFQGYLLAVGFENPSQNPFLQGIDQIEATMGPLVPSAQGSVWGAWSFRFTAVISMTAGTMLLMWLGEQITDRGIGNGISIVITVGIVASLPTALAMGASLLFPVAGSDEQPANPVLLVVLLGFLFAVIAGTVAITQAVRKITVQYAKQVRGNKVYGGQASHLPLKVNYAGVMPIIFAQSLLLFPTMIVGFMFPGNALAASFVDSIQNGTLYYVVYALMIFFFSYFWVATMFNPIQIADDLKRNGGYIPGVRPGKPTAEFLDYTMTRLTLAGAFFLTVIALLPTLVQRQLGIPAITAQFFGGTSLLIIVGVMLDTMRQVEVHLLQRHYDGFLRKGKLRGRSSSRGVGRQGGGTPEVDNMVWLYFVIGAIIIVGVTLLAYRSLGG